MTAAAPQQPPRALCVVEPGMVRLLHEPVPVPRCLSCLDDGFVCEDHPGVPWEGIWGTVEGHAAHGGIGMPCQACCSSIPADGTHSIAEAFTPDWRRQAP